MSFELEPGEKCKLKSVFSVGDQCAFTRGAQVVIEAIDPDPDSPGWKYVVFSARLGKHIRLRGADLQRISCKNCGADLDPTHFKCRTCGWVVPERQSDALASEREKSRERQRNQRGSYGSDWL